MATSTAVALPAATWDDEPTDGSPSSILERYRMNCYAKIETKIEEAASQAGKRNEIYGRYGSVIRYREACERQAEKMIRQRALSLGVVYRPFVGTSMAWASFGDRFRERRAQNDQIIKALLEENRKDLSLAEDLGKVLQRHALQAGLDLETFNNPQPESLEVFDEWHRSPKKMTITAESRGDIVVVTWENRGRESADKDSYTYFRGQKRWLLISFGSDSAMWPHMALVNVMLLNASSNSSAGTKKKDTPRLELTAEGRMHQHRLNQEVSHMITERRITEQDHSYARRNSISNPRLSFLGALNHTVLGYDSAKK